MANPEIDNYVKDVTVRNRERIDDLTKRVEALEAKGQAFPHQDYQPGDEHIKAASHLLHTGEVVAIITPEGVKPPPGSGCKPHPLERPRPHIQVSKTYDGFDIEEKLWSPNPGGWYWSRIAHSHSFLFASRIAKFIEPNWFYNHGQ